MEALFRLAGADYSKFNTLAKLASPSVPKTRASLPARSMATPAKGANWWRTATAAAHAWPAT